MIWLGCKECSKDLVVPLSLQINYRISLPHCFNTEVCHCCGATCKLLAVKNLSFWSSNTSDEAHLDITAHGFWNAKQDAFLISGYLIPMHQAWPIPAVHKQHELTMRRGYGQRVRHIDCGLFTPLIFSNWSIYGQGRNHQRLAYLLSRQCDKSYSEVMGWIRCRLHEFCSSIRSSIMCIQDSRPSFQHPIRETNLTLAMAEVGVPPEEEIYLTLHGFVLLIVCFVVAVFSVCLLLHLLYFVVCWLTLLYE